MSVTDIEIDAAIIDFLEEQKYQMKTAMVIGAALMVFRKRGYELSEDEVAERVYQMVDDGEMTVFGDIKKWRRSEVILCK